VTFLGQAIWLEAYFTTVGYIHKPAMEWVTPGYDPQRVSFVTEDDEWSPLLRWHMVAEGA